jgi:hypothetical protein
MVAAWFLSGNADGHKGAFVAPFYSQVKAACKCDEISQTWLGGLVTADDGEITRSLMTDGQLLIASGFDDDQQVLLMLLYGHGSSSSDLR